MPESTSEIPTQVDRRVPILNKDSAEAFPPFDQIDKQWFLLSEAIRRDIILKPDMRKKLVPFCTVPLSETLPDAMLNALSPIDPRVEKLAERYRLEVSSYLALPAVPENLIRPDISNAPSLIETDSYWQYTRASESGITLQERQMVAKRYKYARDAKILALGAEILEQPDVTPDANGEVMLPSGVKIAIDKNQIQQDTDLLKPHLWQKRRQIKDRVYEIHVNNRKYVLKEKKTKTHMDTKSHGHIEGRTSMDEFAIAQDLQKHGIVEQGRIKLTWEKPIGYVKYPDGFQFAIFGFEEGLYGNYEAVIPLAREILNHYEQFQEEFQIISTIAQKFKDNREVLAFEDRSLKNQSSTELIFEDFALVKAFRMTRQANGLMKETLINNNYENRDLDGYAFRVHDNGNVGLEIVGFDYEYFSKSKDEAVERLKRHKEYRKKHEVSDGINIFNSVKKGYSNTKATTMEKAAYCALLAGEGLLQEDVDHNIPDLVQPSNHKRKFWPQLPKFRKSKLS